MSDLQRNSSATGLAPAGNDCQNPAQPRRHFFQGLTGSLALLVLALAVVTGCKTPLRFDDALIYGQTNAPGHAETIVLREGDVVKISFPTSPNLNASTTIRRDGNISLSLIGDVKAAGKTLGELKADLLTLYKDQTDSKEMTVELVSSLFPVFVTGAVLQPHKVMSDHPITALESIMECGGFDYSRANLSSVTVLRWEGTHLQTYHLNLKRVMQGKDEKQFYMKPQDIIYVREKFNWF